MSELRRVRLNKFLGNHLQIFNRMTVLEQVAYMIIDIINLFAVLYTSIICCIYKQYKLVCSISCTYKQYKPVCSTLYSVHTRIVNLRGVQRQGKNMLCFRNPTHFKHSWSFKYLFNVVLLKLFLTFIKSSAICRIFCDPGLLRSLLFHVWEYPVYTGIIYLFAVTCFSSIINSSYWPEQIENRKSDAKCTFLGRKLKDVNSVQFYAFYIHHQWVGILLIKKDKYGK